MPAARELMLCLIICICNAYSVSVWNCNWVFEVSNTWDSGAFRAQNYHNLHSRGRRKAGLSCSLPIILPSYFQSSVPSDCWRLLKEHFATGALVVLQKKKQVSWTQLFHTNHPAIILSIGWIKQLLKVVEGAFCPRSTGSVTEEVGKLNLAVPC